MPKKLYTQQEVDDLQRQKETQIAGRYKRNDKKIVEGLVRKSNRILATISTHKFPFDFFPDTINIEEGRITVITRQFLYSQVRSIDMDDISNIFIHMSPFFAYLVIVSDTFTKNEMRINNLRKKEAVYIRRIVEGLRTFRNKKIDTSNYTKEELVAKLEKLSTTGIET